MTRLILCLFLSVFACISNAAAQSIFGVVNKYRKVTAVNYCTNTLTITSNGGDYNAGDRILLIQMAGASADNSNTASYGSITNINDAGNYEFATIASVSGNDVTLAQALMNTYTTSGKVQLVKVSYHPAAGTVTVTGTLTASAWNETSGTGGILVVEAPLANLSLNADITVDGLGFYAGLSNTSTTAGGCDMDYFYSSSSFSAAGKGFGIAGINSSEEHGRGNMANGGGGGNNSNSGGAGGSNGAAGGTGGDAYRGGNPPCGNNANGGLSLYSYYYSRMFLGGGGGAGHQNDNYYGNGAKGGGIIIIRANTVTGNGYSITANGDNGTSTFIGQVSDGAGGGGGAGVIAIECTSYGSSSLNLAANGGNGGNAGGRDGIGIPLSGGGYSGSHGPGGGGSGGVIMSSISLPVTVSAQQLGGSHGVDQDGNAYGSTDGGNTPAVIPNLDLNENNTLFTPLVATADGKTTITACENGSIVFSVSGSPLPGTYVWTGPGIPSTPGIPFTLSPVTILNSGIFTVTYNGTCTDTIIVNVIPCECGSDYTPYNRYHHTFINTLNTSRADIEEAGMDNSNNVFIPGGKFISGNIDALVSKINPNGNKQWNYTYDMYNDDQAHCTKVMANGDLLTCGSTASTSGFSRRQLFLKRTNAAGTTVNWIYRYNQSVHDINSSNATELTNGDIVVTGIASNPLTNTDNIFLLQTDANGILNLYEEIDLAGRINENAFDVAPTANGGFIISGRSGTSNNDYVAGVLIRYVPNGGTYTRQWLKTYRTPTTTGIYNLSSPNPQDYSRTALYGVQEETSGNFVVTGDILNTSSNAFDGLVMVTNSNGDILNAVTTQLPGSTDLRYRNITIANNGDYIVCGTKQNTIPREKSILARYSPSLSNVFINEFGNSNSTYHRGHTVFELPVSGDIMMHGLGFEPGTAPAVSVQPYIIRTSPAGSNNCESVVSVSFNTPSPDTIPMSYNPAPVLNSMLTPPLTLMLNCQDYQAICTPSIMPTPVADIKQVQATGITVYPNPGNGNFNVRFSEAGTYTVEVFNMLGSRVYFGNAGTASEINITSAGWVPGVYTVKTKAANGSVMSTKILISE